jgi:hypothetical protein
MSTSPPGHGHLDAENRQPDANIIGHASYAADPIIVRVPVRPSPAATTPQPIVRSGRATILSQHPSTLGLPAIAAAVSVLAAAALVAAAVVLWRRRRGVTTIMIVLIGITINVGRYLALVRAVTARSTGSRD